MYAGINVRRLRLEAGLTADGLAEAAGISSVKIIEATNAARLGSLEDIAKALARKLKREVTVQAIMFGIPPDEDVAEWRRWRADCAAAKKARAKSKQKRAG